MSSYQWFCPPNVNFSALNAPRKENHICNLTAIRLQPLPIVVVVVFSCSVQCILDSWPTHGLQHTRFTISWSLLKLMSIDLVIPSNHLNLHRPLLLPSMFPSIRVFSNASVLHIRWPKYWSFSFSISPLSEFIVTHWIPSNEYSGLISFRIDWFDLLAVQGTLKSLLQHHSSGKCWLPKMSLDSFPLLQFFGWIWERLVLLPLWYSSPVKPSDPELFFVGRFWL